MKVRLFDVLHLLTHLFDEHLEIDGPWEARASMALEPRVLASRLSSCMRKSAAAGRAAARQGPAAPRPHGSPDDPVPRPRRSFCASSTSSCSSRAGSNSDPRLGAALEDTAPLQGQQLGQQRAQGRHLRQHLVQAFLDQARQFAPSRCRPSSNSSSAASNSARVWALSSAPSTSRPPAPRARPARPGDRAWPDARSARDVFGGGHQLRARRASTRRATLSSRSSRSTHSSLPRDRRRAAPRARRTPDRERSPAAAGGAPDSGDCTERNSQLRVPWGPAARPGERRHAVHHGRILV